MTLQEFITANGVAMRAAPADSNPAIDGGRDMDHWRCAIRCGGRRMVLTFSKGSGHHGKPAELAEVLDCLASDAAGYVNAGGFAEWCGEYGYDTDSRKAERTYRIIGRQAESLKRVLGDEAFDSLLWSTDRE